MSWPIKRNNSGDTEPETAEKYSHDTKAGTFDRFWEFLRGPLPCLTAAGSVFLLIIQWSGSGTLCLFRTMTGLPCPGCGLTTAAKALLHGDFGAAATAHAGIFMLPLIGVLWLLRKRNSRRVNIAVLLLLSFFAAYFAIRAILYFPDGPYPMVYNRDNVAVKLYSLTRQR